MLLNVNRNRPAPRVAQPLASAGRVCNVNSNKFFAVRAGNNFLFCNKSGAPYGGAERARSRPPKAAGVWASLRTLLLAARSGVRPRSGRARDGFSRIRSAYR